MKQIMMIVAFACSMATADAQIQSARLQASGLTCAMCARAVYKNLEALPFVSKIDTDLNGSAFILDFTKGKQVDIDAIRKKVEDAGFSIAALDLTGSFEGVAVRKDQHVNYDGSLFHFVGVKDQTISGERTIKVIDKHFTSAKEQKKYQGMTAMECYKTGYVSSCCQKDVSAAPARIYHVTL